MTGADPLAPLVAAITAPVLARLEAVQREVSELRADLARAADTLLDDKGAAAHVGLTVTAFRARVRRQRDLASMAMGGERFRRWRRSELDGYMVGRGKVAK